MKKAMLPFIYLGTIWAAFMYLRRTMFPDSKEKAQKNRLSLISRLRRRLGPPILCPSHARDLMIGQMALIDKDRCERCGKSPGETRLRIVA